MTSTSDQEKIKAVEKALGEPVFCEFSEKTWRIRTKLIVSSVVSISVVLGNLHIEPAGSAILGLKFTGLSDLLIKNSLFLITTYLFFHFIWCSFDNFTEWRLRFTGTKVAFVTAGIFASAEGDYPNDPRQSTLYNWWRSQVGKIEKIRHSTSEIEESLKNWEEKIENIIKNNESNTSISNGLMAISETREKIKELNQSILKSQAMLQSERIPTSLARFNNWFQLFLRSQNLRWFLVEFIFPLILAGYSLILLLSAGIFIKCP